MSEERCALASKSDTYNFCVGQPVILRWDGMYLVPMTRRQVFAVRVRDAFRRWTRWWRHRDVVSAVNHNTGVITIARERWSWRRWRWERIP